MLILLFYKMIFLNVFKKLPTELPIEFSLVIPSVNPLVIKNYYRGIYRRNEAGNFIFLFSTDLPTDKKLPMNDSPTENFRR
jgi:hypothetical protein